MTVDAGIEQPQGDPVVTDPASTGQGDTGAPQGTQEAEPPYAAHLNELPESVRPLVEPLFKKWDADVTQRFQQVHSEYEPWKPITAEYDPQAVQQAIQLAQFLEQNPRELYDRIAQAYGFNTLEQGQPGGQPAQPSGDEEPVDPTEKKLTEMEQALIAIASHLQTQQQTEEQNRNVQLLEQTLGELETKHGQYNKPYVLSLIANGADPEQAVLSWKQELQNAIQAASTPTNEAPAVVSGGGSGVPSTQADLGKLGDSETQDLVVKLLQQANQQT